MTQEGKTSRVIDGCQICGNTELTPVLFLGYLPPVNQMVSIGTTAHEQPAYPAHLTRCDKCTLVQLDLIVDKTVLFPKEYPYTSSSTRILRENFAHLYEDVQRLHPLAPEDLVVDVGSNDGNLLSNFVNKHRVMGVTPEEIGKKAIERGIPTLLSYFNEESASKIEAEHGKARLITATNVFAHMDQVHDIVGAIKGLLTEDGVFVSESHYLAPLVADVQYDTIYHEHMRYYSLRSLTHLLEQHDFEVFHASKIPTHGGSIRVHAAQRGTQKVDETVAQILAEEDAIIGKEQLDEFRERVVLSKLQLHAVLKDIKQQGQSVVAIGAPSRGSTLVNYVGLDDGILDAVFEVPGSHKIGNYLPGTRVPILSEEKLYEDQPEYALLLSWHIAEELAPKIWANGYKGSFIVPLPEPRIMEPDRS